MRRSPRERLGAELRRLRDQAGLSVRAAAERTEGRWSQARLTRAETGHPAVDLRPSDVTVLCDLYGASEDERAAILTAAAKESTREGDSVGALMRSLLEATAAGQVVYLNGPGDDDAPAAAVVPIAVAEAGLAALAARQQ